MDFVKRNWIIIVVVVVLLTATVVLSLMYKKSSAATEVAHTRFLDVIETEIRINTYDVGPTESNVRKAETNIGAAEGELTKLMEKVKEIFPPLEITDLNGFEVKNELVAAYKEMDLALSEGGVENAVASYGFREFDNRIPNSEERKMVLRQLRVAQAMVAVVAESGLVSLETIVRPVDLPMLQHELYEYYTFELAVSGDMGAIRTLLNGLHNAKLCLVVRNIKFDIQTAPMSKFGLGAPLIDAVGATPDPAAGGNRSGFPPPAYEPDGELGADPTIVPANDDADEDLAKLAEDVCTEHRVVWRESSHVEAIIYVDYIEFRQPEQEQE
jgi:hypothetical protein